MGIKGANPVIKERAPTAFFTMPITHLAGKRVCIDAHGWMYANMYTARKKVVNKTDILLHKPDPKEIMREWILSAINFIMGWLSNNVTPIFVFDGPHTPDKDGTKQARKEKHAAAEAKIDELYRQAKGDILAQSPTLINDLRKALANCNTIQSEEFRTFKNLIASIGIPVLQARGDGEQLCSMLCIEGQVAAVFSVDTDNMTYGCPLMITGFSNDYSRDDDGYRVGHVDCVRYDYVVSGMGMTHQMFVDWCIMCGCDYNKNIKGIAGKKALDLLFKYGSIERLPSHLDTTCLKYLRCRELFQYVPSGSLILGYGHGNETLDVHTAALPQAYGLLSELGVLSQYHRLSAMYNMLTPSSEGTVTSLKLGLAPRYAPPPLTLNVVTASVQRLRLNVVAST
jgi:flap endonuclease-1